MADRRVLVAEALDMLEVGKQVAVVEPVVP